jgi:hypothetical protein
VEEKRREENREGKDEKEEKGRKKKIDCECAHHPITITTIPPPPPWIRVLWNCQDRGSAHPGAAGVSAQRGHVPLGL